MRLRTWTNPKSKISHTKDLVRRTLLNLLASYRANSSCPPYACYLLLLLWQWLRSIVTSTNGAHAGRKLRTAGTESANLDPNASTELVAGILSSHHHGRDARNGLFAYLRCKMTKLVKEYEIRNVVWVVESEREREKRFLWLGWLCCHNEYEYVWRCLFVFFFREWVDFEFVREGGML